VRIEDPLRGRRGKGEYTIRRREKGRRGQERGEEDFLELSFSSEKRREMPEGFSYRRCRKKREEGFILFPSGA